MDVNLFLKILGWVGIPSCILGYFMNVPSWKSDIIVWLGIIAGGVRLVAYVWKTIQAIRSKELELKQQRLELKEKEREIKRKLGKGS